MYYNECLVQCKDKVCTYCGGALEPIISTDLEFAKGCKACDVFDKGTSRKIFNIARHMVTREGLITISHVPVPSKGDPHLEQYVKMQTSKACDFVKKILVMNNITS